MCEVVATLPDMGDIENRAYAALEKAVVASPAKNHFKVAAERMVAEVLVDTAKDWTARGWGSRPTWYQAALMAARHVAVSMANTDEMRDAMDKAFTQVLAAYEPVT